jgi:hypothetical protein
MYVDSFVEGRAVIVKKAKGKGEGQGKGKAAAKKSGGSVKRSKKSKDVVQVRENINDLVKDSAEDIATEVIKVAKTGQLASAKYLFEAVGLYPPTEETRPTVKEDSLAHTLLRRMGLPTEPLSEEEPEPPLLITQGKRPVVPTMGIVEKELASEADDEREADSNAE